MDAKRFSYRAFYAHGKRFFKVNLSTYWRFNLVVLIVVILVGSCTQGPSRQEVFDQGNPYFISEAFIGDALGRVKFDQSLQCRLVVERNPKIHVASKAAIMLKISFPEARVIQLYSYPDVPQEEGEKEIKCKFSWSDSLAVENVKKFKGKLSVIFPVKPGSFGEPTILSNEIEVTFKVIRKQL